MSDSGYTRKTREQIYHRDILSQGLSAFRAEYQMKCVDHVTSACHIYFTDE
jgi:hypothetical protein